MTPVIRLLTAGLLLAGLTTSAGPHPAAAAAPPRTPIYPPQSVFLLPPALLGGQKLWTRATTWGHQPVPAVAIYAAGAGAIYSAGAGAVVYDVYVFPNAALARKREQSACWGIAVRPAHLLAADECVIEYHNAYGEPGFGYTFGYTVILTDRNLLIAMNYQSIAPATATLRAHAAALTTRVGAALLQRAERYARTHPHDHWTPGMPASSTTTALLSTH
jgi:hypothetical protein